MNKNTAFLQVEFNRKITTKDAENLEKAINEWLTKNISGTAAVVSNLQYKPAAFFEGNIRIY